MAVMYWMQWSRSAGLYSGPTLLMMRTADLLRFDVDSLNVVKTVDHLRMQFDGALNGGLGMELRRIGNLEQNILHDIRGEILRYDEGVGRQIARRRSPKFWPTRRWGFPLPLPEPTLPAARRGWRRRPPPKICGCRCLARAGRCAAIARRRRRGRRRQSSARDWRPSRCAAKAVEASLT